MSTRLQEAIERAESDWQRAVMTEWGNQNPQPAQMNCGSLGIVDIVPTACTCDRCGSPAAIIPDPQFAPARAFVVCQRCSFPARAVA